MPPKTIRSGKPEETVSPGSFCRKQPNRSRFHRVRCGRDPSTQVGWLRRGPSLSLSLSLSLSSLSPLSTLASCLFFLCQSFPLLLCLCLSACYHTVWVFPLLFLSLHIYLFYSLSVSIKIAFFLLFAVSCLAVSLTLPFSLALCFHASVLFTVFIFPLLYVSFSVSLWLCVSTSLSPFLCFLIVYIFPLLYVSFSVSPWLYDSPHLSFNASVSETWIKTPTLCLYLSCKLETLGFLTPSPGFCFIQCSPDLYLSTFEESGLIPGQSKFCFIQFYPNHCPYPSWTLETIFICVPPISQRLWLWYLPIQIVFFSF